MAWFTYLLECADNTLYAGITTDVSQRIVVHNEGKGAKYTRSRLPVKLVWSQKQPNQSTARKHEAKIKQLSRSEKLQLIKS